MTLHTLSIVWIVFYFFPNPTPFHLDFLQSLVSTSFLSSVSSTIIVIVNVECFTPQAFTTDCNYLVLFLQIDKIQIDVSIDTISNHGERFYKDQEETRPIKDWERPIYPGTLIKTIDSTLGFTTLSEGPDRKVMVTLVRKKIFR